jgi:multiple sugar transport system ATP-binding protein
MASLEIRDVVKRFGSVEVLKNINIDIDDGEFLVLVGPSGCGKSTLLNIIAGLETPTEGEISIAGNAVNDVHPKDRDIAMVFQSYALYPNMTVRNNITFGMRVRKTPKDQIEQALKRVSELLQITPLLDRKPSQLSGGQRQRVAMGRALVRDPKIFLFDEPLSNLDAKLRVEMRTEIKKLHQRLSTTIVYVTHDQIEAITLATRIAVMKDGIVQQFDTPQMIYDQPANAFVAGFMGSPAMNLIPAKLTEMDGKLHAGVSLDGGEALDLEIHEPHDQLRGRVGAPVVLGLRPEAFGDQDHAVGDSASIRKFISPVEMTEPTGPDMLAMINMGGVEVTTRLHAAAAVKPGSTGRFTVDMSNAVFFDPKSGERV